MSGTTREYPHFFEGQVLTHDDLNELQDYLRHRDRSRSHDGGRGLCPAVLLVLLVSAVCAVLCWRAARGRPQS